MRRDGSRFVSPNAGYQNWERTAAQILALMNRGELPISEPVNVAEVFYMPTARRVDLLNLQEAIDDALVRAGVLSDDSVKIVAGHEGSTAKIDRNDPRIEITITPAQEWQIFEEVKK